MQFLNIFDSVKRSDINHVFLSSIYHFWHAASSSIGSKKIHIMRKLIKNIWKKHTRTYTLTSSTGRLAFTKGPQTVVGMKYARAFGSLVKDICKGGGGENDCDTRIGNSFSWVPGTHLPSVVFHHKALQYQTGPVNIQLQSLWWVEKLLWAVLDEMDCCPARIVYHSMKQKFKHEGNFN